jgi:hypothetical protein
VGRRFRGLRFPAAVLPLAFLALLLLPSVALAGAPGHYVPVTGDRFAYAQTITVTNGRGDYLGYSEDSDYNGSVSITAVLPNGTESAAYQVSGTYRNSSGGHYPWSESGTFTFSAVSFEYVQGTDNQSGFANPLVWFYMNNSLAQGASFSLLDTPMKVVATNVPFPMSSSSTGYVATTFAEGNGSYQRNDDYGKFAATYNWKAYFDPGTGYIVGYTYTEVDSNASGDGFTYTDTLSDTQTTFALTPTSPPGNSSSSPTVLSPLLAVVVVVAVVVILVLVVYAIVRRRGAGRRLPRHPTVPAPGTMPTFAPPPALNLVPRDQPPVQQVVIREIVKAPCAHCGTLIDTTVTNCPNCGAPRT